MALLVTFVARAWRDDEPGAHGLRASKAAPVRLISCCGRSVCAGGRYTSPWCRVLSA